MPVFSAKRGSSSPITPLQEWVQRQPNPLLLFSLLLTLSLFPSACTSLPKNHLPSQKLLAQAQLPSLPPQKAIGLSLSAANSALADLSNPQSSPQLRATQSLVYNSALALTTLSLRKNFPHIIDSQTGLFPGPTQTFSLQLKSHGSPATKDPRSFASLLHPDSIPINGILPQVTRPGLGAPLVGIIHPTGIAALNARTAGFAVPITAVATFRHSTKNHPVPTQLSLLDPQRSTSFSTPHSSFPLQANFSAPLSFYKKKHDNLLGIAGMLRSDEAAKRAGIYFCQPYDPKKIPIIFVHGLMSSPQIWLDFINQLNANPSFRQRYQPWVFFYPSGAPIAGSALRFHRALAELHTHYPHQKPLVLVGHSMGGIISRMQVTDSGLTIWKTIFTDKSSSVYDHLDPNSPAKDALILHSNPDISRVIFLSTPHQGSDLANLKIANFISSLIRLPTNLLTKVEPAILDAINLPNRKLPSSITSISSLSPKNPLLLGLSPLPITVPCNSIIGNRGHNDQPLADSSDGVVPYWSSHLSFSQSEIIVPTSHDSYDCPQSVAEILRILKLPSTPSPP